MFRDNSVANTQAKTSSLTHGFCRVERIKHARSITDARAAIGKFHKNGISLDSGAHPEVPLFTFFKDRVNGVVDQIQEHLLKLVGVGRSFWQVGRKIEMQTDLAHP